MKFSNEEINKAYASDAPDNTEIHAPGKTDYPGYRGKLADVQDASILDGMIKRGSQLVTKITPKPVAPTQQAPTGGFSPNSPKKD